MAKKQKSKKNNLDEIFEKLIKKHGKQRFITSSKRFLAALAVWIPDCDKEYSYTYEHIVEVENCSLTDEQEAAFEAKAKELAEKKVENYCKRRNDNCTSFTISESSPTGGGCNCGMVPMVGLKCIYVCRWTVKYKCTKAA